jgi:hypothetical protein
MRLQGVLVDPETFEPVPVTMLHVDGGVIKGTVCVFAAGTLLFQPGSGQWSPDADGPTSDEIEAARNARIEARGETHAQKRAAAREAAGETDHSDVVAKAAGKPPTAAQKRAAAKAVEDASALAGGGDSESDTGSTSE